MLQLKLMLQKMCHILIVCYALTGLANAQATGQRSPRTQEFVIRGRIVLDTPQPPADRIEVRLERTGRQLIDTVFSDSIGNFMFRNVLPETYYVAIEVEGFEPARERVELSSSFNRVASLYIFLQSKAVVVTRKAAAFAGDPKVVDIAELRTDYPSKAVGEYEKALKDSDKGNVKKAISRLEKSVKMAPDFYQAQNNLGVQYRKQGRYRESEQKFRLASELNQNSAQPLINLGSMFLEEGEQQVKAGEREIAIITYQKAIESLERAIVLDAFSPGARYYLGSVLYKTGQVSQIGNSRRTNFERSEAMLQDALALDEDYHAVRLMLVNLYLQQVRYPKALEQLTAFLKRNPDSPQAESVASLKRRIEKALNW